MEDFSSKVFTVFGYVEVLFGSNSSVLVLVVVLFFFSEPNRLPKQELLESLLSLTNEEVRDLDEFGVIVDVAVSSMDFWRLGTSPENKCISVDLFDNKLWLGSSREHIVTCDNVIIITDFFSLLNSSMMTLQK